MEWKWIATLPNTRSLWFPRVMDLKGCRIYWIWHMLRFPSCESFGKVDKNADVQCYACFIANFLTPITELDNARHDLGVSNTDHSQLNTHIWPNARCQYESESPSVNGLFGICATSEVLLHQSELKILLWTFLKCSVCTPSWIQTDWII